jgi:hypothetical protein
MRIRRLPPAQARVRRGPACCSRILLLPQGVFWLVGRGALGFDGGALAGATGELELDVFGRIRKTTLLGICREQSPSACRARQASRRSDTLVAAVRRFRQPVRSARRPRRRAVNAARAGPSGTRSSTTRTRSMGNRPSEAVQVIVRVGRQSRSAQGTGGRSPMPPQAPAKRRTAAAARSAFLTPGSTARRVADSRGVGKGRSADPRPREVQDLSVCDYPRSRIGGDPGEGATGSRPAHGGGR